MPRNLVKSVTNRKSQCRWKCLQKQIAHTTLWGYSILREEGASFERGYLLNSFSDLGQGLDPQERLLASNPAKKLDFPTNLQ